MSPRQYGTLVRTLASSEFKLRFADSALGYTWTLSKPLMLFGVMYVVFNEMLKFGAGIEHYPIVLLTGIMFWGFHSEATSAAVGVLVTRADLVRKAWFPRSALPVSVVTTAFLVFLTNLVAIGVFMAVNGVPPRVSWLWFIPIIVELVIYTIGLSLLLSGLYVFIRDIGQIWAVLLQVLFYATPIIYPVELLQQQGVSERVQQLLFLNPMAQIVQDTRAAMLGGTQTSADILGSLAWAPFLLIAVTFIARKR